MDGLADVESLEEGFYPPKPGPPILSVEVTMEDFIIVREQIFSDL